MIIWSTRLLKSLNLDQLRHSVSWKFDQLRVDLLGDWICCRKVGIKVLNENEPQTWEISEPQKQFQFFKNGRFINWKNLGLCRSFLFRWIILRFQTSSFRKTWASVAGVRGSVVSGWMWVMTSNPLNWLFLVEFCLYNISTRLHKACAPRIQPHGPSTEYNSHWKALEADLKLNFLYWEFQTGYFSFLQKIPDLFNLLLQKKVVSFLLVLSKWSQIEKFPTEEVDEVESDIIMISTKRSLILFNRLIRQKHQQHLKQYQRHNYSNNIHHRTLIFRCAG